MHKLKVFVASPGDVRDERALISRIVDQLDFQYKGLPRIEKYLWEENIYSAGTSIQIQIPRPSTFDLCIFVFWSRLGSPLPSPFLRPDREPYASGTEYEFEDAINSYRKTGAPHVVVLRKTSPYQIGQDMARRTETLEQINRVEEFIRKWFPNDAYPLYTYQEPSQLEDIVIKAINQCVENVTENLPQRNVTLLEAGRTNPYRGLEFFDFNDAHLFRGRTKAYLDACDMLKRQAALKRPFLLVSGMSGCGKSSLVRAGILPHIVRSGLVEEVDRWRHAIMRPSDLPGSTPFDALASALLQEHALPGIREVGKITLPQLSDALQSSDSGISILQYALNLIPGSGHATIALVVDQLEEVLRGRDCTHDAARRFDTTLASLIESGQVWVIAALRNDFLTQFNTHMPRLREMSCEDGHFNLQEPSSSEFRQMIQVPAIQTKLSFEEDAEKTKRLDDVLLVDALRNPRALPLLEFTLYRLFEEHSYDPSWNGLLTFSTYERIGCVEGAVAQYAERVFEQCNPDQKQALPRLFRNTISLESSGEDHVAQCSRVRSDTIATDSHVMELADKLIAERLLTTNVQEGVQTVEITHDALLRNWKRAAEWIDSNRELLLIRRYVREAWRRYAQEPDKKAKQDLLLPKGKPVQDAHRLLKEWRVDLEGELKTYIQKSQARVRRRRRIAWYVSIAVAMAFLSVSAVSYILNYRARLRAERQKDLAMQIINNMTFDFADKIERIPGTTELLKDLYMGNIVNLHEIWAGEDLSDPKLRRHYAVNLAKLGRIELERGNIKEAWRCANASFNLFSALASIDPKQSEEDMVAIHTDLAGLLSASNDIERALTHLNEAQGIVQRLLRAKPGDTDLETKLAGVDSNMLALLATTNDYASALQCAQELIAVLESLCKKEPDSESWRWSLFRTNLTAGDILQEKGDLEPAMKHYASALAAAESLLRNSPEDKDAERSTAFAHKQVGICLLGMKDYAAGEQHLNEAIRTYEHIRMLNPSDAETLGDLSRSYRVLGGIRIEQNRFSQAAHNFGAALNIARELVHTEKKSEGLTERSQCEMFMALLLERQGSYEEVKRWINQAIASSQEASAQEPENPQLLADQMRFHREMGHILLQVDKDVVGSGPHVRKAVEIGKWLRERYPLNPEYILEFQDTWKLASDWLMKEMIQEAKSVKTDEDESFLLGLVVNGDVAKLCGPEKDAEPAQGDKR